MVGQRPFDLHSAIDRPGVHDHCVRCSRREALLGEAIAGEIFAGGIAKLLLQPLPLDAQRTPLALIAISYFGSQVARWATL